MTKKRVSILGGLGITAVVFSVVLYWFYFSEPTTFPENKHLLDGINRLYPEAVATEIQDSIPVDNRHVLVPFISKNNDYGLSYWTWQKRKWRVAFIDTKGTPMVWKTSRNDPSGYFLVWNLHPGDQLSSIQFYLIRERGYRVSDDREHYDPRVQMEEIVPLDEKLFGAMKLPDEWKAFMEDSIKVESTKQPDLFFESFFPTRDLYFGWIPIDQAGNETFPERSVNGNSYSTGKVDLDFIMIMNQIDLE